MPKRYSVRASDYETYDVVFDDAGQPETVTQCRLVWVFGKDHGGNAMMTERIRRVIEEAQSQHARQQT